MIEAMGFGRPVLRTPYGGCSEWIEDGENGFVCPAAEVDVLVETLKRALSERSRWREMGLAAHAKIKRDLDLRPARVFLEALRAQGAA
jgi:glycosyltransferase involved in cell wall biosynthesis